MSHSQSETCTIHNVSFGGSFTMISNKIFENQNLSWEAKGLLCYILSRPSDWKVHTWQLAEIYQGKKKGNGRDSIKKIVRELKDAGYINYIKSRNDKGLWQHRYDVYPMPFKDFQKIFPETDYPAPDQPAPDHPSVIINTESNKTEINTSKEDIARTASPPRYEISFSFEKFDFEGIEQKDLNSWKEIYPCVDVPVQLKKMKEWIISNPMKCKTRKKWRKFINDWLSKNNEHNINKEAYQSYLKKENKSDQKINVEYAQWSYENLESNTYDITLLSGKIELTPKGSGQVVVLSYLENGFKHQLENALKKHGFMKKLGK